MVQRLSKRIRMQSLVLVAAATALSGCQDGSGPGDGNAEAAKKPLEVTWMNVAYGAPPQGGDAVGKRIEQETNTRISWQWVPLNGYKERLNVALNTGDLADITQVPTSNPIYETATNDAIKAGVFHDLTPYLTGENLKKYPHLAAYPDSIWDNMLYNGKIWGIPRHPNPPIFTTIHIRKDLLDKAGLPAPTTWEELTDTLLKLSDPPNMYGMAMKSTSSADIIANAITGIQNWEVDQDGNFAYRDFMPDFKVYLKWLKMLYDAGALHPEFPIVEGSETDLFKQGHYAAIASNTHMFTIPDWLEELEGNAPGADVLTLKVLKGPKGYATSVATGSWTNLMISSKVPEADIDHLLRLIDFTSSQTYQQLALYGVEGIHYEKKDGVVVKNATYKTEGIEAYTWNDGTYTGADNYLLWNADPARLKRYKEVFEDSQRKSTYSNPAFNLSSPALGETWGDLTRDLEKNKVKFVMGVLSEAEWDAYVAKISTSAEFKTITAELKTAYNKYK
ncbi:extracellular solute-binding protein [Cohnella sp. GCM10027633]|uniref:extracellular solute-binding protein n=1 Tax=unclassified Cohnella TaxID=2636738 RepID=UPI00363F48B2